MAKPILIHGIPTSGKTTLLKKIGKECIEQSPDTIVIFLSLGKIWDKTDKINIKKQANNQFHKGSGGEINWNSKNQKYLILLDGLDEVVSNTKRNDTIIEVKNILNDPNIQIILSSRTNDYIREDKKIDNTFEKFELMPLTIDDMEQMGRHILTNQTKAASFIKMLKKSKLAQVFPKTPLTTILLAILFKEETITPKDLPRNLTELYAKFMDLFLNKWDKNKGISEQFKIKQKEFILHKIAFQMHQDKKTIITKSELINKLSQLINEYDYRNIDPQTFIKNILERSNILIQISGEESYSFFHLTIQEYLVASQLTSDQENLLCNTFEEEWWLNPNIFYAGKQPNYAGLLNKIKDKPIYTFLVQPIDLDDLIAHVIHLPKVLLAAHQLPKITQQKIIKNVVIKFDYLIKNIILFFIPDNIIEKDFKTIPLFSKKIERRIYNKTILDIILFAREFFKDCLGSQYFIERLEEIWNEFIQTPEKTPISEITLYCLAYRLAVSKKDATYLEEFINKWNPNVRWYRIIDVDMNIIGLKYSSKKTRLNFKSKYSKNEKYIQSQFQQKIARHYNSITGLQ